MVVIATKDSLGDRMKTQYEDRTRFHLPRRTFTIVRLDGRGFHNYTKGLERPYDVHFSDDMDLTTRYLCESVQGCQFGYVQSDEISLLLTDFDSEQTQAFFNGNLQKLVSVTASMATAEFNKLRLLEWSRNTNLQQVAVEDVEFDTFRWAQFDSRAFTIPDRTEVMNYFIWRQQDAMRNSISMLARCYYSHNEVQGKSGNVLQEMLMQDHGINWSESIPGFLRGRFITAGGVEVPPVFTQDTSFLDEWIPEYQ